MVLELSRHRDTVSPLFVLTLFLLPVSEIVQGTRLERCPLPDNLASVQPVRYAERVNVGHDDNDKATDPPCECPDHEHTHNGHKRFDILPVHHGADRHTEQTDNGD